METHFFSDENCYMICLSDFLVSKGKFTEGNHAYKAMLIIFA